MEKSVGELMTEVSPEDWSKVPASVLRLIEELVRRVEGLEKEMSELRVENELLREQLSRTSANSSQPPSKNPIGFKPNRKEPTGKKRGGQEGHKGHERKLYSLESCGEVIEHVPTGNCGCGTAITVGEESKVHRHQIVEVPPIKPIVTEHRFYVAVCPTCGKEHRASEMSEIISRSGYGPRVAAYVGLLSSQYRQSYRQVKRQMEAIFGIEISVGAINHLRTEVSESVSGAVSEATTYLQSQPRLWADETRFTQRNGDGQNASKTTGWLWTVMSPLVVCFRIALSRSAQTAQDLIGAAFAGLLTTDRCSSYIWVPSEQRQVCWAHLVRDFIQISERTGVSAEFGLALLAQEKILFTLWYQFRDGTLTRPQLQLAAQPIQTEISRLLQEAADISIAPKENTPLAKTVGTCRKILTLEISLWLFLREDGIDPTNNLAERTIRPAVIWRRTSFGSDSADGSLFVSRLLSVVSSLLLQQRDPFDFILDSVTASRSGGSPPSLLPLSP
jgi:transposase